VAVVERCLCRVRLVTVETSLVEIGLQKTLKVRPARLEVLLREPLCLLSTVSAAATVLANGCEVQVSERFALNSTVRKTISSVRVDLPTFQACSLLVVLSFSPGPSNDLRRSRVDTGVSWHF
jgi:hypothetical protein